MNTTMNAKAAKTAKKVFFARFARFAFNVGRKAA